jgi:peptidoglycan/xylan/chitin deacetylase (PgdA/CDA1 family)
MVARKKRSGPYWIALLLALLILATLLVAPRPQKKVVIEIDDLWNMEEGGQYFARYGYSLENYRALTDVLDRHGYVATLAVTPHIFIETENKTLPLRSDEAMLAYLRGLKSEGYEIAMHGYSHCLNRTYCDGEDASYENIADGKQELEDLFGSPLLTYVPPGNLWKEGQYQNVRSAGFKIMANSPFTSMRFDGGVLDIPRAYDPVQMWGWYTADFWLAPRNEWVAAMEKSDSVFVLQLHCNTFDTREELDDLDAFLTYLGGKNAKVMTYSQLYAEAAASAFG